MLGDSFLPFKEHNKQTDGFFLAKENLHDKSVQSKYRNSSFHLVKMPINTNKEGCSFAEEKN